MLLYICKLQIYQITSFEPNIVLILINFSLILSSTTYHSSDIETKLENSKFRNEENFKISEGY